MSKTKIDLESVTMMEAVHALREHRVYIQFERALTNADVDRSRQVVDSKRRFDVSIDLRGSVDEVAQALVSAEPSYDWVDLATTPPSVFLFPRSTTGERFASSALAMPVSGTVTEGQSVADALGALGVGDKVELFDRAGFLARAHAGSALSGDDRPGYQVVGELFASSGDELLWDVTSGPNGGTVMSITRLVPP